MSSDTYLAPQYDPTKTPRIEGMCLALLVHWLRATGCSRIWALETSSIRIIEILSSGNRVSGN